MTTTNSLSSIDVFSIAGEIDNIRNHLRVTQEMMMDLLSDSALGDVDQMRKVNERLWLLVDQIPAKLSELNELNDDLLKIARKETAAA